MAMMTNTIPQPINLPQADTLRSRLGFQGADRSIFGKLFAPGDIAREDWLRDLQKMEYTNQFNAEEAQKQRDFEQQMSNTAYQRAIEDMKIAGINPILAVSQGGASTPSGASASGSSLSNSSYGGSNSLNLLGTLIQVVAGIYTKGATNATAMKIAKMKKKF